MGAYDWGAYSYRVPRLGGAGVMLTENDVPSIEAEDFQDFRQNRAVRGIQVLLLDSGYDPKRYDGVFGWGTRTAVRRFQRWAMGLPRRQTTSTVGYNTFKALLTPHVRSITGLMGIPSWTVFGVCAQESGFDVGAQGYINPPDLGLVQVNTNVHTVAFESCFDPVWSLGWLAERLRSSYDSFVGHDGGIPKWDLAVASHHAPTWARQWADGTASPDIVAHLEEYVRLVKEKGTP